MNLDGLSDELSARAQRQEFSGVVRIDGPEGVRFEAGYGPASYTWAVPATPAIRFDTASITKLFTAVAVLQQLEAGEDYEALFAERANYWIRQAADLLPGFVHKPGNFPPGAGCRYCNVSYVLLGMMVEKATGTPYRDYVTAQVFRPAGMDRAGFFALDRVEPEVAEGVEPVREDGRLVGWRRDIYAHPPVGTPDAGAHVTASDLIAFHSALVAGRLVSPASVATMLDRHGRHCELARGVHWTCYGFECETDAAGRVRSYWKEGINVGVSGMLRHYPEQELTVVVLSNRHDGAWEPVRLIDQRVGGLLGKCGSG